VSVTFDSPVAFGFPATSGYADDPVNTASGNFLIAETDVPVGGLAAGLAVRRIYNSRSDRAGAFGPGWSSWADTRLHAREEGAEYAGPDGQRALFPRQGAGYGRVLGVPASVQPAGDGLELRWFGGPVWTFDATGRPAAADSGPGTQIEFGYDGGRLVRMTHPGGRSVEFAWDGERITAVVASDGRRVDYGYADGVLTAAGDRRYTVDDHGRVAAVVDADGVAEATNSYDGDGRVLSQVSRFGRVTRFAYLPGGVTVTAGVEEDSPANTYVHDQHGRLLAVVDGHGQRLSRTYDQWGNPVSTTERSGAVSAVVWDDRNRPVRRTGPDGAAFDYRYDDESRLVEVTDASGATTRFRYTGAERLPSEITDQEGDVTRLEVSDGLVRRATDPDGVTLSFGYDTDGAPVSATDGAGNTARLGRDAAGRVVEATTPLGRRTVYHYRADGQMTERIDPAGALWRYEYTAAGRPAAIIDPAGARHEYRYGPHGAASEAVDPLGRTTTWHYDDVGSMVRAVSADGSAWAYRYDALSRLVGIIDPAGAQWLREYDVNGNIVASVDPVGTRYAVTIDPAGRVTALDDGLSTSAFEFDRLGRVVAHTRPDGTAARAGYDRCGRRTTIEDPTGGVTRIEYTPAGRIRRVISPSGRADSFEYHPTGRLAARIDGAGRRWEFRYDADGALTERRWPDGLAETFTYDDAGRLCARQAPGRVPTRYRFDAVGRPVEVGRRLREAVAAPVGRLPRRQPHRRPPPRRQPGAGRPALSTKPGGSPRTAARPVPLADAGQGRIVNQSSAATCRPPAATTYRSWLPDASRFSRTDCSRQSPSPRTGTTASSGPSGASRRNWSEQDRAQADLERTVSRSPARFTFPKPTASPEPSTPVAAVPRSTPRTTVARSAWSVVAASGPSPYSRRSLTTQGFGPLAVSVILRYRAVVCPGSTASWVKERPETRASGSPQRVPSRLTETENPYGWPLVSRPASSESLLKVLACPRSTVRYWPGDCLSAAVQRVLMSPSVTAEASVPSLALAVQASPTTSRRSRSCRAS
jgi:YD repeat-containing protein